MVAAQVSIAAGAVMVCGIICGGQLLQQAVLVVQDDSTSQLLFTHTAPLLSFGYVVCMRGISNEKQDGQQGGRIRGFEPQIVRLLS